MTPEPVPATALPQGQEPPPRGYRAMALVRWAMVLAVAAAAAASVVHFVRSRPSAAAGTHRYTCPMHPQIVHDRPGSCPICHMDLVPIQAGAHTHSEVAGLTEVTITPDRVRLGGIATEAAREEALGAELATVGVITAREDGLTRVSARFAGWIERVTAGATGQRVKRGQLLATIHAPELAPAQEELLAALRWGARATPEVDLVAGARRRLALFGFTATDIAELERTGQPLRALPVRAPASGHLTLRNVVPGTYVEPGSTLFEISDLATVWLLADVQEHELGRVAVGQTATVRFPAFPQRAFTGRVAALVPTLDGRTRTARARIPLANRAVELLPGMWGEVTLELPAQRGITVPADALVETGEVSYVFVALPGGRFEPRRVAAGLRTGDRVQLTSGVAAGELVVTSGNFLVDSESRLRAVQVGQP